MMPQRVQDDILIGDLSREFGLTLRTIRFYEGRGLLKPGRRGTTRLYTPADRERLRRIVELRDYDFSLAEIARMVAMTDREALPLLRERAAGLYDTAQRAAQARFDLLGHIAAVERRAAA